MVELQQNIKPIRIIENPSGNLDLAGKEIVGNTFVNQTELPNKVGQNLAIIGNELVVNETGFQDEMDQTDMAPRVEDNIPLVEVIVFDAVTGVLEREEILDSNSKGHGIHKRREEERRDKQEEKTAKKERLREERKERERARKNQKTTNNNSS